MLPYAATQCLQLWSKVSLSALVCKIVLQIGDSYLADASIQFGSL